MKLFPAAQSFSLHFFTIFHDNLQSDTIYSLTPFTVRHNLQSDTRGVHGRPGRPLIYTPAAACPLQVCNYSHFIHTFTHRISFLPPLSHNNSSLSLLQPLSNAFDSSSIYQYRLFLPLATSFFTPSPSLPHRLTSHFHTLHLNLLFYQYHFLLALIPEV